METISLQKPAGCSRGAQAVSLISSCFYRALLEQRAQTHTDATRREESAPCGLPALHGSQPAVQPAVRNPPLFSKPLLLQKCMVKVAAGLPVFP